MCSDLVKAVGFVLHLAAGAVEKLEVPGHVVYTYQLIVNNLKTAGFESEKYSMWPSFPSDLDLLSGRRDGGTEYYIFSVEEYLPRKMDDQFAPYLAGLFRHISTLEDQKTRDDCLKLILSPPPTPAGDDKDFVRVYQSLLSQYICWWLSENAFSLPNDDRLHCYGQLLTHLGQLFPQEDEPKTEKSGDGDEQADEEGGEEETTRKLSIAQMFLRRKIEEIQATIKVAKQPVDITTLVAWLSETERRHRTEMKRYSSRDMTHLQGGWLLAVVFMFLNEENLLKYRNARANLPVLDVNNRIGDFDRYFERFIDKEIGDHVENAEWTGADEYGGDPRILRSVKSEYCEKLLSRIVCGVKSVSSHRDAEDSDEDSDGAGDSGDDSDGSDSNLE